MKNKLAVCMPAYNAESFIKSSVESILSQTYSDFVFVITDDCSTDRTYEILQSMTDLRIELFRNDKNLGTIKTRNDMISYCLDNKFQYMAIMDADDIAFPDRLRKQIALLENDPSIAVCGSSMEVKRTGGIWLAQKTPSLIKTECIFGNPIPTSTAVIRMRYIRHYDLRWDEKFRPCADYHLWYRMLFVHKLRALNTGDVDMIYTYSPAGVSHGEGFLKQEIQDATVKKLICRHFEINASDEDAFAFMKVALYRSDDPEHAEGFLNIAKQLLENNETMEIVDHDALKRMMSHRASTYMKRADHIPKQIQKQIKSALISKLFFVVAGLEDILIKIKSDYLDRYFPNLSIELVKIYFEIREKLTKL